MSWRPKEWPKNPCDGCKSKREDDWGLICDIACGNHTRWKHFERGADAMLDALFKLAKESPTKTFTIDSQITQVYEAKN